MIGPKRAKELLAKMDPNNRGIRWTHVTVLAKKMKAGLWRLNGELLKLDTLGNVLDGQHRLLAVVRSGCTVPFDICHGIEYEAVYTMDEGAPRALRDKISRKFPDLKQKKIYREISEIYTKVLDYELTTDSGYEAWGRRARSNWNYPEVFEWVTKNKELLEFVVAECKREEARAFMRPISVMGAMYFICLKANETKARRFFTAMIDGVGYSKGKEDPAYWCRKEIEELHAHRISGSDPARWPYMAVVCRAFNLYVRNGRATSGKSLRVTPSQPFEKLRP
jgi:hypothetical protein